MNLESTVKNLPHSPGVYIYKNIQATVIYVGKAINLSKRVRQYFERDDAVGDKTPRLVSEIATIETIQTENEFDALLLEAKLIKFYQPKFNVIAKDDKSPLYIAISMKETLPRVTFARRPKLLKPAIEAEESFDESDRHILYFGPFQSGSAARDLLRTLRRVVPYCTQKQRNGKKCFYTHLGLCQPCPSYISKLPESDLKETLTKQYRRNIFRLRDILSGKTIPVINDLEKEMEQEATEEHFEAAAALRNQIQALKSILTKRYDPSVYLQSDRLLTELFNKEREQLCEALHPYYPHLATLHRIECFDISNTMGTNPTASMVVMTDGRIDKAEYKKFKIRAEQTPNDFAMMQEALGRRLKHTEWLLPDLLVIDGGKGQVGAVQKILQQNADMIRKIPIIGLAKREEEIVVPVGDDWKIIRLPYSNEGLKLLRRLRDEAHRFAITYHKLLRGKTFL